MVLEGLSLRMDRGEKTTMMLWSVNLTREDPPFLDDLFVIGNNVPLRSTRGLPLQLLVMMVEYPKLHSD